MDFRLMPLFITILLVSCQSVDPCSNPEAFVKKHTQFVDESVKNAMDYSNNDWKQRDAEFEDLMEKCFEKLEDDLTGRQKETITTNSAKYVSKRVKNSFDFSFDGIEKGLRSIFNKDFENNVEGIEKDFENLFDKDFEDKLGNVFDEDFKKKLNDLFDDEFRDKVADVFDEEFKEDLKTTLKNVGDEIEGLGEKLIKVLEDNLEEKNK